MQSFVRWVLLWVLLLYWTALPSHAYAQQNKPAVSSASTNAAVTEGRLRFAQLTADDGLAQNSVQALLQDRYGFLWVGTQDGLSRFDGYHFVTYRHDPQQPSSLSHNFIRALLEDREGRLWIATQGGGVDRFEPTTNSFHHYGRTPANPDGVGAGIFALFQDRQGHFWFGGPPDSGLTKLVLTVAADGTEETTFTHYYPAATGQAGFPGGAVWVITEDGNGTLWLAADQALVSLNSATAEFTGYAAAPEERRLAALFQAADGTLWLGGSAGLYHFDQSTRQLVLYPDSPVRINALGQDQAGQLLVATHGDGLYWFDPQTGHFTQAARPQANDSTSLSENRVTALLQDRSGILWLGTDSAGLNRVAARQNQFTIWQHMADDPTTLAASRVTALTGVDSTLWVGTGGVLNRLDLPSGQLTQYNTPVASVNQAGGSEPTNTIYALYEDSRGALWLGLNDNQVLRFDPPTAQFTPYALTDPTAPRLPGPPSEVVGFSEDQAGVLWVAVNLGDLYRIAPDRTTITAVPIPPPPGGDKLPSPPRNGPPPGGGLPPGGPPPLGGRLNALAGAPDGVLWLGYGNGRLLRFDPSSQQFATPVALPNVSIETIYATAPLSATAGLLWVGTRNGLLRVDPATGQVQSYTESDGLPSSLIVGILADATGQLWLSTDKGLSRFDRTSGRFRNFDKADGLPGNEFSPHAAWSAPDGSLFFGSSNGLLAFAPQQIVDNPYQPPVVLTDLLLYNEPVLPGTATFLPQPIWATQRLTLRHDQGIVTFAFAALDFAAPQKNRYRYKLEGLEAGWNSVDSSRRFATYTSLPAGEYTFRVQGSNSDGLWSEHAVALTLTVLPPWWQTVWFRGLLVVTVLALAYAGYHWRVRAIEAQNRLLETQVTQRTQALAESEARFRELATSAFEAILIHDGDRLIDANAAATLLFGYTQEQLVGKTISELLTPWQPTMMVAPVAHAGNGPSVHQEAAIGDASRLLSPRYEVEGVTATGRRIPLEVRLRTAPYQGRPAVITALYDLTEHKQVESQRQRMAALEERERIGRELHDDLGQVMGYMNVQAQTVRDLLEQGQEAQARIVLNQLVAAAQEAHEDVRHYILGIRQSTPPDDNPTPVGLIAALDLYVGQLQDRYGMTVHLSLPAELANSALAPEAETQLLRIIQEALTNIRKHAGVNSARLLFTQHPDELQVVIADDGMGFALEETHHAPRTTPAESADALPHFGLSIMQERAASIGGEVEIRSTPGVGTQVIVHLPRQLKLDAGEFGRGLRVLLVDDHPLYLDGLRTMLAARGVQVVGMGRNGLQAQQLARTLYPDLILMDVEMPVCNGIEATRAIKAELPQIKIVMLTVAADDSFLFEALKLGASGYLLKNLDSGHFFHLLREVMRGETVLSPRLATQVLNSFAQDDQADTSDLEPVGPSDEAPPMNRRASSAPQPDHDLLPTLTHRQQAVLKLVVQGLTNKEIAKELSITERTVKYHIGLILERLQLRSRYELARYAQEQGFTAK